MSYPKVPPKPKLGATMRLPDERKQRLLKLQEREELKGLLVNKFKKQYGPAAAFIAKEVETFMKQEPLTESNLQKLDEKIKKRSEVEQAKVETKSNASKSMKSSVKSSKRSEVSASQQSSSYVHEDEDDEWAAILEYDTILHREEERARRKREAENKVKLKRELDRQLHEKGLRKELDQEDFRLYEEAQRANLDTLEQREKDKEQEYRAKVLQEKTLRDQQLKEELKRKRNEEKQQHAIDQRLVERLKEELHHEHQSYEDRRLEERVYMQQMMGENVENKRRLLDIKEQERQSDVRSMEEYAKMLDRQEQDRLNELRAREERQQLLMARMADTVLKEQQRRNLEEDLMLLRQIDEKEQLDQTEDDRRLQQRNLQKKELREYLDQQVTDKKHRKGAEKDSHNEQAEMWRQDAEDFFRMENQKKTREQQINQLYAQTLIMQIEEKQNKKQKKQMNPTEARLNKDLLKRIKAGDELHGAD